jgi:hypothetical protein
MPYLTFSRNHVQLQTNANLPSCGFLFYSAFGCKNRVEQRSVGYVKKLRSVDFCSTLAMKLSNAVKGIDGDYVKKLQSDAIPDSLTNEVEMASKDGVESYKPCFARTASLFLSRLITRLASRFLYLITSAFSITAFSISERER